MARCSSTLVKILPAGKAGPDKIPREDNITSSQIICVSTMGCLQYYFCLSKKKLSHLVMTKNYIQKRNMYIVQVCKLYNSLGTVSVIRNNFFTDPDLV